MCSSHQPENGADSQDYAEVDLSSPVRPAWQEYWTDNLSPHPDAEEAQRQGGAVTERVLASFSQRNQTHYCHHYRLPGEHYHSSVEELERCEK